MKFLSDNASILYFSRSMKSSYFVSKWKYVMAPKWLSRDLKYTEIGMAWPNFLIHCFSKHKKKLNWIWCLASFQMENKLISYFSEINFAVKILWCRCFLRTNSVMISFSNQNKYSIFHEFEFYSPVNIALLSVHLNLKTLAISSQ